MNFLEMPPNKINNSEKICNGYCCYSDLNELAIVWATDAPS